jgi:hypothetical protein
MRDKRGPILRVIDGGRGGDAAVMRQRLYELHAKQSARTITEVEWQQMRRIELLIGWQPEAYPSPLREAICGNGDPFGPLAD